MIGESSSFISVYDGGESVGSEVRGTMLSEDFATGMRTTEAVAGLELYGDDLAVP